MPAKFAGFRFPDIPMTTPFERTFGPSPDLTSLFSGTRDDRRRAFKLRLANDQWLHTERLWRFYEKIRVTPGFFGRMLAKGFESGKIEFAVCDNGEIGVRLGMEGWLTLRTFEIVE